jgi:hypothetical protein
MEPSNVSGRRLPKISSKIVPNGETRGRHRAKRRSDEPTWQENVEANEFPFRQCAVSWKSFPAVFKKINNSIERRIRHETSHRSDVSQLPACWQPRRQFSLVHWPRSGPLRNRTERHVSGRHDVVAGAMMDGSYGRPTVFERRSQCILRDFRGKFHSFRRELDEKPQILEDIPGPLELDDTSN